MINKIRQCVHIAHLSETEKKMFEVKGDELVMDKGHQIPNIENNEDRLAVE